MYNYRILFLLLIIFVIQIHPQPRIENKVQKGLNAIYNFEWDKGAEIFNSLIEDYPESAVGYHYLSTIPLWYYLGSFSSEHLDTFFIYSDKALDLVKKIELEDSLTAELAYMISAIYKYRSIANARAESYISALWASDRMKYYASRALELNEKLIDAHIGLGLYDIAVSQIPSSLQWAIKLVGVNADRETALLHLEKVSGKGKLARIDAMFYLSQIYSRIVIEPDEAYKILKELTARYPKNLLFKMSMAWVELELGEINSAEKKIKSVLNSTEENFPLLKSLSQYQLGNIYFYKNQTDSAIFYYKQYLNSKLKDDFAGLTNYNIGVAFELSGERDSAVFYYKNTPDGNLDLDEDSYAKRKGQQRLTNELSADEIKLVRLTNLFFTGNYKKLIDSTLILLEDSLDADLLAECYLLLSRACLKLKKYDESLKYSVEAIHTETKNEKWIHPFALYNAAVSSFHLRHYLDSQLFLNLVSEYSDYDFQIKMEGLRYALQRRLINLEIKTGKK